MEYPVTPGSAINEEMIRKQVQIVTKIPLPPEVTEQFSRILFSFLFQEIRGKV